MALPYAKNALAKLQRDDSQRHRTAEIGWLDQHIRKLEAEAPTEEPNRGIGGNNPPPEARAAMLWGAIQAHMDDHLPETPNWASVGANAKPAKATQNSKLRHTIHAPSQTARKTRGEKKK